MFILPWQSHIKFYYFNQKKKDFRYAQLIGNCFFFLQSISSGT